MKVEHNSLKMNKSLMEMKKNEQTYLNFEKMKKMKIEKMRKLGKMDLLKSVKQNKCSTFCRSNSHCIYHFCVFDSFYLIFTSSLCITQFDPIILPANFLKTVLLPIKLYLRDTLTNQLT